MDHPTTNIPNQLTARSRNLLRLLGDLKGDKAIEFINSVSPVANALGRSVNPILIEHYGTDIHEDENGSLILINNNQFKKYSKL